MWLALSATVLASAIVLNLVALWLTDSFHENESEQKRTERLNRNLYRTLTSRDSALSLAAPTSASASPASNSIVIESARPIAKRRSTELYERAEEERQRCCHWLLRFIRDNEPKFLTKAELRDAAIHELNVSKNSFDIGWIEAIEQTGRYDWYEPLHRRRTLPNGTSRIH